MTDKQKGQEELLLSDVITDFVSAVETACEKAGEPLPTIIKNWRPGDLRLFTENIKNKSEVYPEEYPGFTVRDENDKRIGTFRTRDSAENAIAKVKGSGRFYVQDESKGIFSDPAITKEEQERWDREETNNNISEMEIF